MESRPATIILDPIGGISGDMFLAGVLDAWPELAKPVLAAIRENLPAGCDVSIAAGGSAGLACAAFVFDAKRSPPTGRYAAFRERLEAARLAAPVRGHALELLGLLAEAEAAVHRVAVERVHFHELADWDTQADLIGAAMVIDLLEGASWHSRPLPVGTGTVGSAHGPLPLPAPAAAELLRGFAFRDDDGILGERVTPTGAAILRYLGANQPPPAALGSLVATGTGAGTRQFPGLPNVLRVLGFARGHAADSVLVIEFDIDDQSPEDLAAGLERLREVAGIRDVISFQGIGKKGRWIQSVRLMADPARREPVVAAVFEETTTLGLRIRQEERAVLPRHAVVVDDGGGRAVRVKIAERASRRTAKAEADDVAAYAKGASGRAGLRRSAAEKALRNRERSS